MRVLYHNAAMQQRRQQQYQSERLFAANEVADFEHCPLVWWYEQFDPLVQADNEELFARMVELEHDHGAQATGLPEYQVIEQMLLRRGAFTDEQKPPDAPADEMSESAAERDTTVHSSGNRRLLWIIAFVMLGFALFLIAAAYLLRSS